MIQRKFESPLVDLAYILLPTLWFGLLVGVSFIATPVKFQAASLSLPVALDVGRATFTIWNKVEWFLLAAMVPVVVFSGPRLFASAAIGALGGLLLIQSAFLLPALNDRIVTIIAGGRPPSSPDHLVYIAVDVLKLGILGAVIWKEAVRIMPVLVQLR